MFSESSEVSIAGDHWKTMAPNIQVISLLRDFSNWYNVGYLYPYFDLNFDLLQFSSFLSLNEYLIYWL